ncbi:uncharacterized protein LOC141632988 [Silene latifolia]|uniref:uncharacterized protein LOC141632988 n=1 Tax=Silene latifolia TaxID=37657 RepID=UPI003D770A92
MDPVYPKELFRRRFRMRKHVFMRIVNALSANDRFFQQRPCGNGRLSFSTLQRCTAALRVLAYGTSTDSVDEYLCSLNDINFLQRYPLFNEILEEYAPAVNYTVYGTEYKMGYYLTDAQQESCRKDVERAFGVLQARFAFIKRPCLLWDRTMMGKVLMTCIIMHNMIVGDERETYHNYENIIAEFKEDNPTSTSDDPYEYHRRRRPAQERFAEIYGEIRDRATNIALKNDLIEHIWQNFRN